MLSSIVSTLAFSFDCIVLRGNVRDLDGGGGGNLVGGFLAIGEVVGEIVIGFLGGELVTAFLLIEGIEWLR